MFFSALYTTPSTKRFSRNTAHLSYVCSDRTQAIFIFSDSDKKKKKTITFYYHNRIVTSHQLLLIRLHFKICRIILICILDTLIILVNFPRRLLLKICRLQVGCLLYQKFRAFVFNPLTCCKNTSKLTSMRLTTRRNLR